jgi:hypothetical protein
MKACMISRHLPDEPIVKVLPFCISVCDLSFVRKANGD